MNDVFLTGKSVVNQKLVSQWSNHFCNVSERSSAKCQIFYFCSFIVLTSFLTLCVTSAGMPSVLDWTDDGFSMCFGVNHLGHFLLTNLLLPRLKECAPSRVVTLTCSTYKYQKLDFQDLNYNLLPFFTYCRSKLANIYFSQELARITEGKGVTSYAVHPGKIFFFFIRTDISA